MATAAARSHDGPQAGTAGRRAEPEERRAAPASAPALVLRLQASHGNAAVARAVAPLAIQRCGTGCGCTSCGHDEDEWLTERRGAGVLRSAVERRATG